MNSALIVVDAQKGFTSLCPDELPVPDGQEIVPVVNELLGMPFMLKFATQDWHPEDHVEFKKYPPHCRQNTPGSEFIPGIHTEKFHAIWRKGYDKEREMYSVVAQHPYIRTTLQAANCTNVFVCGLATNICVLQTAIGILLNPDPRKKDEKLLTVYIVEDASAGIDVPKLSINQEKDKAYGVRAGVKYINMGKVRELVK